MMASKKQAQTGSANYASTKSAKRPATSKIAGAGAAKQQGPKGV